MKYLVMGTGSIGERHIQNLKEITKGEIIACDLDKKRLDFIKDKYKIQGFSDIDISFEQNPDIILVCTPPNSHIPLAIKAVYNKSHVLIEKPMSDSMKDIDKLINISKKNKKNIFIAYCFRFEKGIQLIKKYIDEEKIGKIYSARAEFGQYLPDWRPWQDYRKSYTSNKNLGGGIILDGSHEIDYMRWFFGDVQEVFCYSNKISNLEVNTEDVAEIFFKFKNEIICNIHLDFIRPGYHRFCEIIGEKGMLEWNFSENNVKYYNLKDKSWKIHKLKTNVNDMYVSEIKHFIKSIDKQEKSLIDGEDGKKSLQLALAAKKSSILKKVVKI